MRPAPVWPIDGDAGVAPGTRVEAAADGSRAFGLHFGRVAVYYLSAAARDAAAATHEGDLSLWSLTGIVSINVSAARHVLNYLLFGLQYFIFALFCFRFDSLMCPYYLFSFLITVAVICATPRLQ